VVVNVTGAKTLGCLMRMAPAVAKPIGEAVLALGKEELRALARDNMASRSLIDPMLEMEVRLSITHVVIFTVTSTSRHHHRPLDAGAALRVSFFFFLTTRVVLGGSCPVGDAGFASEGARGGAGWSSRRLPRHHTVLPGKVVVMMMIQEHRAEDNLAVH
jgi:hypothetical protein